MKLLNLLTAASTLSLAMWSCSGQSDNASNEAASTTPPGVSCMAFSQDIIQGTRYFEVDDAELDGEKCFITFTCTIDWPRSLGEYDLTTLQDSVLRFVGGAPNGNLYDAVDRNLSDLELFGYSKATQLDSLPKDMTDAMMFNSYYADTKVDVAELTDAYITLNLGTEMYSGGAHGMYSSQALSYASAEGKIVNLAYLFKPGHEKQLVAEITNSIAQSLTDSDAAKLKEMLLVDSIPVSKNVGLQGGMIVFRYNPYEILPYSCGMVDAEVSPYSVRDALTPEAIKLLGVEE